MQKEIAGWLNNDFDRLNIFATHNIITSAALLVAEGMACALTIEGAVNLFDPDKVTFKRIYPELAMTSVLAWKKFQPFSGATSKFLEHFKSMQ